MNRICGVLTILALTTAPALAHHHHASRHSSRHASRHAEASQGFTANASFYGGGPRRYEPNSHTANGELFNMWDLTAAHRTPADGHASAPDLRRAFGGRAH